MTVCIATFGHPHWQDLARERAAPSAAALEVPVVQVHGETLHDARNTALSMVETEWVVHLDADDELDPGYLVAMAAGTADLRAPAVSYVRGGRPRGAYVPQVAGHDHPCAAGCLRDGNWLVVGSLVRAELVRAVGGWRDFAVYEDWDLWLRCWLAGATVEAIPTAVYRAHVRPDSRNRAPARAVKEATHRAIVAANASLLRAA